MIDNRYIGPGTQSKYSSTQQNINYGGHHVDAGGLFHIDGDININTSAVHREFSLVRLAMELSRTVFLASGIQPSLG